MTNQQLSEKAKELAKKDADKEDIQTTAEGKAFLSYRFKYHFRKLSIREAFKQYKTDLYNCTLGFNMEDPDELFLRRIEEILK